VELSPQTRRLVDKIAAKMDIAPAVRDRGIKKLMERAEPYAKKRGHHFIRNVDAFEALRKEAPPEYRPQIIEALEKVGIDTDKEFGDWKQSPK
jgi:GNAT superfamily N-acetyltransferase